MDAREELEFQAKLRGSMERNVEILNFTLEHVDEIVDSGGGHERVLKDIAVGLVIVALEKPEEFPSVAEMYVRLAFYLGQTDGADLDPRGLAGKLRKVLSR